MKDIEKQQRDTKQRRLVYASTINRCDHPTADQIYEEVHNIDKKISKGTVYRNLNLLSQNGDINNIELPVGPNRFDSRLDNHYHILCLKCGKVVDSLIKYDDDFDFKVAESSGFLVAKHVTIFEGICPDCQSEEDEECL